MSKTFHSKLIEAFSKAGIKPLKFKPTDPNKIVEIYTDEMKVHGIPPIRMTMKKYTEMQNRQTKEDEKALRKYLQELQEMEELKKHRSNDPIMFDFACS